MPTEHEYKYILDLKCFDVVNSKVQESVNIEQGYLLANQNFCVRIRSLKLQNIDDVWFMTLKKRVGDRVVEIETEISNRDGIDLWEACTNKVKKRRYYYDNECGTWEIDFFRDDERYYFAMMEIELSEGDPRPTFDMLPEFLKEHVIRFDVHLTDDKFSNTNLGNVDYATQLFNFAKNQESI